MATGLRWRFSVMMFFQYLVWCMWQVKLGTYLNHLGFKRGSDRIDLFSILFWLSDFSVCGWTNR